MPKNKTQLFTSGYEGLHLQEFIDQLLENKVELLIDIRELPISRKKGFSKKRLEESLLKANIKYLHCRELGSPRAIRKKVREDGDFDFFFEEFGKHLESQKDALREILEKVNEYVSCLLCYEKDHQSCHRKIVTEEILNINSDGMTVKHL